MFISNSAKETVEFGRRLAKKLKPGDVVALVGELGSGKTTLVKGIAAGLGVKNGSLVNSPSFVLIKEYKGKIPLYHFDLYRLKEPRQLEGLGYEEYFWGDGVCVVEWAERAMQLLPKRHIRVELRHKGNNKRSILLK